MTVRRFLRDAHGGATAIAAAAVTVMAVGGAALVGDHAWLVDQRDVLKTGADAAAVAATHEMTRRLGRQPDMSDEDLQAALVEVARRYVEVNLRHLPEDRLARARETLVVEVAADREQGTVEVTAEADLGGFLFASRLPLLGESAGPNSIRVDAGVECTTNVVEVVLALDITASMNGKVDRNGGDGDENHRLKVAIEAAKGLVNVLYSGCNEVDLAVGVVPWDKAVRLDAPDSWRTNGWVDMSPYRNDPVATEGDWAGCVEDRTHDLDDLKTTGGLSLALPRDASFPAFLYPDTSRLDAAILTDMRERVFDAFPAVADTLTPDEVETRLLARGDNNWSDPLDDPFGPNYQCTNTALLPLTSESGSVIARLEALDDQRLWGGNTSAHVGVTWGRRMLAPTWREVWGGDTHPVDPAGYSPGEVTKALVLLTDGLNGGSDPQGSLPGEIGVRVQGGALELGCNPRGDSGCTSLGDNTVTRYSSLGRIASALAGRAEDGFRYPPDASFWGDGSSGVQNWWPRKGFNTLMQRSCELAREEGVSVYTVSLLSSTEASWVQAWKNNMVDCSGTAETLTRAEREAFHFDGRDQESLADAFRAIGQRLPHRAARPLARLGADRRDMREATPLRSKPCRALTAAAPYRSFMRPLCNLDAAVNIRGAQDVRSIHHHSSKENTAMQTTRTTKHISRRLRRFARANEAASALEYTLVVGVVATVIAAALITFGENITDAIATIGDEVTEAEEAADD